MAIIPYIKVEEKKTTPPVDYSRRGRVAFIGCFDASKDAATKSGDDYTFIINNVNNLDEAYLKCGTDTTAYPALKCLPLLFKGATSMVTVNLTVGSDKTIDADKLGQALNALLLEDFDILFIGAEITDQLLAVVKAFDNTRLTDKRPFDYVGCGTRASAAAYTTSVDLMPRSCNFIIQTLDDYSLLESAALVCGVIAGNTLDTSLTNYILPDVSTIGTEYTFGVEDLGYTLVSLGYTVFKITNRLDSEVQVLNGRQFNKFDGYINRCISAVIDELSLRRYLGKKNNNITIAGVSAECARIKQLYVNDLGFIKDIVYYVEKATADKVIVKLTSIVFDGVITEIEVYYTVEVE